MRSRQLAVAEVRIAQPEQDDIEVAFAGVAGLAETLGGGKVAARELMEFYLRRIGRSVALAVRRPMFQYRAAAHSVESVDLTLPGCVASGAGGLR